MSEYIHNTFGSSLVAQTVKNLPAVQEEAQVQSLDQENPLEKRIAVHSSILAWRIPWTKEPEGYSPQSCRVRHDLMTFTLTPSLYNENITSVQSDSRVWLLETPMDCSTPGLPVHCQLQKFTQTHICDGIQPSHPLLSPSPPAFNLSQHQGLFKRVSYFHQVAKVLKFLTNHY